MERSPLRARIPSARAHTTGDSLTWWKCFSVFGIFLSVIIAPSPVRPSMLRHARDTVNPQQYAIAYKGENVPDVAALYVDRGGVYDRPDVDLWDINRDARFYSGPLPVVAHPPCERWSRLAHIWAAVPGRPGIGEDGGCFAAALAAVERYGGVLEHPLGSAAWPAFGLPAAPVSGWARTLYRPGWSCRVEQGCYGHFAPKPTLLYYVGATPPPPLLWCASGASGRIVRTSSSDPRRRRTPLAFAELLLSMARGSRA